MTIQADTAGTFFVVDTLTLRFDGSENDGTSLHELRAAHVAEMLQGLVGLTSDFAKAGVFDPEGSIGSEVLVRPAEPGSWMMDVLRVVQENPELTTAGAVGGAVPSLGKIIWWATRSMRAGVEAYEHQDNGMVKVTWQDGEVREVPRAAWNELQKRKRVRKKQLFQIMAALSDPRVESLEYRVEDAGEEAPEVVVLDRDDYLAARPSDEIEETDEIFEVEAQMSAIDFDNADKWRVRTLDGTRTATVEDEDFLGRVAASLAIRKSDIFRLRIREDTTTKNGRSQKKWTVLEVISHRRASGDDDDVDEA